MEVPVSVSAQSPFVPPQRSLRLRAGLRPVDTFMSLLSMHLACPPYACEAAPGPVTAAIPSLPSGPADRIYVLDGQLVVAVPLARYEALIGSQHAHANHFPLPSHDIHAPMLESSAGRTWSAYGSPATTEVPYANASISATAEPGNSRLDNPRARTRVPVACVNCHELRKSCDAARPCQRCMRRGLSASCVDHTRAARRSSASQSPSDSSPAMTLPPAIGDNVPFVGSEGQGGSSGQNAPLLPPQYPSFLLEETANVAAANNVDMSALWSSY